MLVSAKSARQLPVKQFFKQNKKTRFLSDLRFYNDVVRDLGILFHPELTMKKHTAKIAAVCFFHIRRLRQICRRARRQRRYHPPCAGFDNAAVGLLQLGVRGLAAVDT